jgi:archaellum component FlaF (FlaF/FlaG flagellin family)
VAGTTLTPGASATLPASPPATFTLNFTNTGQNQETNVVCKVTVSGTPVSGQTVVPQTTPGQQTSCNVPLSTAPPTGTDTVTATIERVPGELSVQRNSQSFQITFK